jgi:oligoribonuclease NrnB/cAMP/cGMP phosphodiesterase (DHH superfamily)
LSYARNLLHIVSHTDLDGVVSAVLAWHMHYGSCPMKVTLTGYGSVDSVIMDSITREEPFMVFDLFCQHERTIDEIDLRFESGSDPLVFDHHESNFRKYANRDWLKLDTKYCAAKVYFNWLESGNMSGDGRSRLKELEYITEIANDRDLWINAIPESRLWHALVTVCGPWSVFSRLVANPSGEISNEERDLAVGFVEEQERRFSKAIKSIEGNGKELAFVGDGILDFGDVSDFGGLVLDRMDSPPMLLAMASRRFRGDWAVSMRSRNGFAGRVSSILQDGKKIRGGGHDNAAALYFPPSYSEMSIKESLLSAMRTLHEQERPIGATLGDIFRDAMKKSD